MDGAEVGPRTLRQVCYPAEPGSTMCVQSFDDSRGFAVRITYRISLRSSSLWEPRHPLLKIVSFQTPKADFTVSVQPPAYGNGLLQSPSPSLSDGSYRVRNRSTQKDRVQWPTSSMNVQDTGLRAEHRLCSPQLVHRLIPQRMRVREQNLIVSCTGSNDLGSVW